MKRTCILPCLAVLLLLVSCSGNTYLLVPSSSPAAALLGTWRNGTETYRFHDDYSYTYTDSNGWQEGAWRIVDGMLMLYAESFSPKGGAIFVKEISSSTMKVSLDNLAFGTWNRTGTGSGIAGTWTEETGANPASLEITGAHVRYTERIDGVSWVQYGGTYASTGENPAKLAMTYTYQMRKYGYAVNATTLVIAGTSYLSY